MLALHIHHKKNLHLLSEQSLPVLHDFCKLVLDYLHKGPNLKLYTTAAQKLEVETNSIQNSIEGLVYLLMESVKYELTSEKFQQLIISLGFNEDKVSLLCEFYRAKRSELENAMINIGLKLPEYHNMEWRFETQIASRTMLKQIEPLVTMDVTLKNTDKPNKLRHIILQADATNIAHLTRELETALQEKHNHQIRKIKKSIK